MRVSEEERSVRDVHVRSVRDVCVCVHVGMHAHVCA